MADFLGELNAEIGVFLLTLNKPFGKSVSSNCIELVAVEI